MIDILMRELLDMPEQQIAHIGAEPLRGQGRIVLADHGKAKACKHHQQHEQAQPEHDMKIAADHAVIDHICHDGGQDQFEHCLHQLAEGTERALHTVRFEVFDQLSHYITCL